MAPSKPSAWDIDPDYVPCGFRIYSPVDPKVYTPAATTASAGTTKEAFEVKVTGYGTDSPSFSITAPPQALIGSQDGPNPPVKIVATVEYNGQEHEICSTFNSLKILNAADTKAASIVNGAKDVEVEEAGWPTLQDKITALAMDSEKSLMDLRLHTSETAALSTLKKDREMFHAVQKLTKNIEQMKSLAFDSSMFATTVDKEYLKLKVLEEMYDNWGRF